MWRRRKDNLKRRMMSGILACLLVATSLTNTVGIITSFAGQTANIPRVSYKYDDLKNDKGQLDKMVQINVQAENESFAPGSEMVLKVYVQNLSDQNLTGGSLKWSGKGLEEAGFLDEEEEDLFNGPGWDGEDNDSDTSDLMEELGNFSVTGLRKSVALKVDDTAAKDETEAPEQNVEIITDTETEEEEDDTSDPQTNEEGKRIRGIELAPGEVYETRFYGTVEDMDSIVTRKVTFEFLAGTDDNTVAQDKAEFTYNTGMALVLPIEFDDGPALMTNELNTMYIHTRFEDEKILDEYTWEITDEDEATPSDAERHEITVATMSNGTEDSNEGTTPANMKYSIVTYGAKLEGIEAWYDDERSGWGEMTTGVSFRVKDDTEPGVYFGQVTTSIRREGKSYKTTQGFHFFVLGDGQLVLKGNINGAEIQVKGDRSSFPEGDMLSLKVTEVPAEKMDLVQEAMVQKAEELGVSVDKMKAMDIKVIADGVEQELEGEVEVTFSNLTLEKVEETIGLEGEEGTEDGEVEELEEINTNAVFGLRKASAGTEEDQADAAGEGEIAEAENESEGEEKEEATLAVWHLDEEAGVMNEMDSEVNDDGDVVMGTSHFSIYVVVDVNGESVNVRFQHVAYLRQFDVDGNGYVQEHKTNSDGTPKTKLELAEKTELTKIYSSEVRTLRNGLRVSPEDMSKLDLANRTEAQKNYELKEIWVRVTNNINDDDVPAIRIEDSAAEEQERSKWHIWTRGAGTEDGKYIWNGSANEIKISQNSIIRFIYEPKQYEVGLEQGVEFYDYDVTEGVYNTNYVATNDKGANQEHNYSKNGLPKLAIGQTSNPINHSMGKEALGAIEQSGDTVTKAAYVNQAPKGLGNNYVEGIVQNQLGSDKLPIFNVDEPGLFSKNKSDKGITLREGYELRFKQDGDTYTLTSVYNKNKQQEPILNRLDEMTFVVKGWGLNSAGKGGYYGAPLFSNNFWPLDKEPGKDPLFGIVGQYYNENENLMGENDDTGRTADNRPASSNGTNIQNTNNQDGHNWFFGMVCEMSFVIGDYVGPLTYYFRGDDDFWLFLDNELIVDIGGIHPAASKSINIWPKIKDENGNYDKNEKHTLKVFFTERGAAGSCCYMQFTLPNVKVTPPPFEEVEHTSISVKKVWADDNNAANKRPSSIEVDLLQNGEVYRTATLAEGNDWSYTWNYLPKDFTYTVKEKTIPQHYTTQGPVKGTDEYNQYDFVITNTYHEPTSVTVTKRWKDEENKYGTRPQSIMVQLKKDDKDEGNPVKLSDTNQWTYTWENLPKYSPNGDEYQYTVEEVAEDWLKEEGWYEVGYTKEPQGENHWIITNTYTPEYVEKTVIKRWNDQEDRFGLRSKTVTVQLLQNGELYDKQNLTGQVDLSKENNWTKTWSNLPKYRYFTESGNIVRELYKYEIKEVEFSNSDYYETLYQNSDTGNVTITTITNTLKTAKFRVAKSIDNYLDATEQIVLKDLLDDEFIVKVEEQVSPSESDKAFSTGLVLKHAETEERDIIRSREVSGYIELPVTDSGTLYKVTEIVPKEYTPSKTDFLTTIALDKTGNIIGSDSDKAKVVKEESIGKFAGVRIFPDADVIVVVHNDFKHEDYFHHDVSVTNLFKADQRPHVKSETFNLVVSMNAFLPEEMGKDWERKHQDEERLM